MGRERKEEKKKGRGEKKGGERGGRNEGKGGRGGREGRKGEEGGEGGEEGDTLVTNSCYMCSHLCSIHDTHHTSTHLLVSLFSFSGIVQRFDILWVTQIPQMHREIQ